MKFIKALWVGLMICVGWCLCDIVTGRQIDRDVVSALFMGCMAGAWVHPTMERVIARMLK
jgi:hypothetical protein